MSRMVKVSRLVWAAGVVPALALAACATPSPAPGGDATTTTTAPTATTGPSTTTAAPTTVTTAPTSTTAPATTTTASPTTTAPPDTPADPAFGDAVSISTEGYDSSQPRVAFDREGDALVVWVRVTQDYPHPRQVEVTSRNHDGTWGPIIAVSPAGQAPGSPHVAVDDDGEAVVAWHAFDGVEYRVYARRVSSTGTLGALQVLSGTGVKIHGTDLAVDPDGDAVVTWAEWQPDGSVVPKMRRFPSNGELPAEVVLSSSPRRADTPAVAFDREGDAVVAWANDNVVQARTLAASGALGELETVSGDVSPIDRHSRARVTIDRDGDALVTWRHLTQADLSEQVWGRWVSRDGALGAVQQLTPASHTDFSNYSVAGDLDGDVVLTWDLYPIPEMYVRQVSRTGTLGEPALVTSYGRLHTVGVDDDGDAVVVWQGEGIDNSTGSVRVRRVTQAGAFEGPEQVVVSKGVSPTVAVAPTGGALLAWERRFQADLRVQVSDDL
jgi:hypothetical protein